MGFDGSLIKIGNQQFPLGYIQVGTYKITPNQRQDLDSYVNANGVLKRSVVEHTRSKIEFTTTILSNADVLAIHDLLESHYLNRAERKVLLTYYDMETDSHKEGTFYVPDIEFTISDIDSSAKAIRYAPARIAFIEY